MTRFWPAFLVLVLIQACDRKNAESDIATEPESQSTVAAPAAPDTPELTIDDSAFVCLDKMTAVRHFFVDNLLGDLEATLAVAEATDGGVYPPGSVVQLVPTEVMIKHRPGWNAATRDWEFFELDVSEAGSSIRNRGFVDVVNRFGVTASVATSRPSRNTI